MIKYRQLHVGSDCTGPYEVTISLPMTVREFISELLETYPNEWGCIGIYQKGEIFGNPYCEYKHGKLVDTLPVKYMDMQIESVNGSGGWTNSDYILHIKEEQKISDEEESRWTKCSPDNLPDMDSDVLGTRKDYGDVVKVARMKTYIGDAGWEWVLSDDIEGNSYRPDEIIAWMPLPQPYREGE